MKNIEQKKIITTGILTLILFVLIAYIPAFHAGYVWDDDPAVTDNTLLRTGSGLIKIWTDPSTSPLGHYWPMVYSTFWLEYHVWGLNPFGYHLDNVFLHILNVILLFLILHRLSVPGAWFIAAIFGLHPVQVESVAWVVERKNVLSGMFYLLTFLAYLKFEKEGSWRDYFLAIILFSFAMLSKTITVTLPLIILLWLWWKNDLFKKQKPYPVIPFFIIAGLLAMNYVRIYHQTQTLHSMLTFPNRIIIAGRAIWFYAGKLFWPMNLTVIYPRWQVDSHQLGQYIFPLSIIMVLIGFWYSIRFWGKGPLVCILFYILTLLPVLNIVDQPGYTQITFVNDHAQYLACIGLIILVVSILVKLYRRFNFSSRRIRNLGIIFVLFILGMLTWMQAENYKDMETLFRQNLSKNPKSWVAYYNIANELARQGKIEEAIQYYSKTVEIVPRHMDAHNNLGMVLEKKGLMDDAIMQYKEALDIKLDFPQAQNNLAILLAKQGKMDEAIMHYTEAIRVKPDFAEAHNNLGLALARKGNLDEAIAQFTEALKINPSYSNAGVNLKVVQMARNSLIHKSSKEKLAKKK